VNHNSECQNAPINSQMQPGIKIAGTQSMLLSNNVTSLRTRGQVLIRTDRETAPVSRAGTFTLVYQLRLFS
jgi:hypothetical protein